MNLLRSKSAHTHFKLIREFMDNGVSLQLPTSLWKSFGKEDMNTFLSIWDDYGSGIPVLP